MITSIGLITVVAFCYGFIVTRPIITRDGAIVCWGFGALLCGLSAPPDQSFATVAWGTATIAAIYTVIPFWMLLRELLISNVTTNNSLPATGDIKGHPIAAEGRGILLLSVLLPIHFAATACLVAAIWVAQTPLLNMFRQLYDFGPGGVDRIKGILQAAIGVLSLLGIGYWAYKGQSRQKQR